MATDTALLDESNPTRRRVATSTSNFGAGRRESHDATAFYERFPKPELSDDATVLPPREIPDPFVYGDARSMSSLADGEVALVVTSPPYFAGKQYEQEMERDGIPSSYAEYLELLGDVFADCRRVLEPGGRIAVNVANLGRKPYRSLASDVVDVLSRLGLLLRGEIVWRKAAGATGSCAWGSYRSAANPALRDVTERVVVASKGRFDRALKPTVRAARNLPWENTMTADDFMVATLDLWEIPPESAKRVNHPAPFPVALPERLIHLYTYQNDLVLDPFMGSGSTMVAASRAGRRYVGYDLDPTYVELARGRVAAEGCPVPTGPVTSAVADAEAIVGEAGFTILRRDPRVGGVAVDFTLRDSLGREWVALIAGGRTVVPTGINRVEAAWALVGRVHALRAAGHERVLVLTVSPPKKGTQAAGVLRTLPKEDVIVVDVDQREDALAELHRASQFL
jgi:DNA modification methylase